MTLRQPYDPGTPEDLSPPEPPAQVPVRRFNVGPFTGGFVAVCVAVFLGQLVDPGLIRRAALYGPAVTAGQWWRVATTVFVHSGLLHIGFNMMAAVTLGTILERVLGVARSLVVVVVTALGAAALILLFAYRAPVVGASGVIIGFMGVLLPIATQLGRKNLMAWLIQVALISLIPGISWQGHLGGFLAGLPCGYLLKLGPKHFDRWVGPLILALGALVWWAALYGPGVAGA